VLITLADDQLLQSPVKCATSLANFKCAGSSFQFPFLAFPFSFYYRFGHFHYRFIFVFTDVFVSVLVFVNGICLSPFLHIFVSANVNFTDIHTLG